MYADSPRSMELFKTFTKDVDTSINQFEAELFTSYLLGTNQQTLILEAINTV